MSKRILEIFPNPFMMTGDSNDCRNENFHLYGLHKRETFDSKGDIIRVEYFKDYDPVTPEFSNLAVDETRTYTRDANTGLPVSKATNIDWYDDQGNIQAQKLSVTKYYSPENGFVLNKKSRKSLIDKASMYLYSALIAADPLTAEANVEDFEDLTDLAQSKYVKSNMQPLIDIIANSTDNTKPEYRDYITTTIRDTLLLILNVSYKS